MLSHQARTQGPCICCIGTHAYGHRSEVCTSLCGVEKQQHKKRASLRHDPLGILNLLQSSCMIIFKHFVHIFTIIMVVNSFKKQIFEVTKNYCTVSQHVKNLFVYNTALFECLLITAQVYSFTTSNIILSILLTLK